jgi:hypothetical protein
MTGKPFVHGDPRAGRPRGARNKLATTVLRDLLDVWNEPAGEGSDTTKGVAALRVMAIEDPSGFAKLYSSLLPKELTIEAVTDLADGDVDADRTSATQAANRTQGTCGAARVQARGGLQ